jgi:hypothetical protein
MYAAAAEQGNHVYITGTNPPAHRNLLGSSSSTQQPAAQLVQ